MRYRAYPVFLSVSGRLCVVVGGGQVAERKVKRLLQSNAEILIISPEVTQRLRKLIEQGKVSCVMKKYEYGDIPSNSLMVFECVGDKELVRSIKSECDAKKILLNSATYPELSDFFVPALVRRRNVSIAISTMGKVSAFSKALREKIEKVITPSVLKKLKIIEKIREELLSKGKKTPDEDRFLLEISRIALEGSPIRSFVQQVLKKGKKYKLELNFRYVWDWLAGTSRDIRSDFDFCGSKKASRSSQIFRESSAGICESEGGSKKNH